MRWFQIVIGAALLSPAHALESSPVVLPLSCEGKAKALLGNEAVETITKMGVLVNLAEGSVRGFAHAARVADVDPAHVPPDQRNTLSVWATLKGGHAKVLNIEWLGERVNVISFRRGEWESELLAMGRTGAVLVH